MNQQNEPTEAAKRAAHKNLPAGGPIDARHPILMSCAREIDEATGLPQLHEDLQLMKHHAEKGLDGEGEPEDRLRAILAHADQALAALYGSSPDGQPEQKI